MEELLDYYNGRFYKDGVFLDDAIMEKFPGSRVSSINVGWDETSIYGASSVLYINEDGKMANLLLTWQEFWAERVEELSYACSEELSEL